MSALVLVVSGGAWALTGYINDHIKRVDAGTADSGSTGPLNILVAGVDPRTGLTHHEEVVLHVGNDVSSNSDTLMLVHVSADRSRVTVVSIPRDSWVNIPGHGMSKINAAYGYGGARLMVQTVEQATGLTINDYIEVDFLGFVKVIDALGGVNICLPQAVNDAYSGLHLSAGMHHVNGITALAYARDRHSFATSDLARIQDQQRLVSSALTEAIHSGLLANPVRLSSFISASLSALTVDQGLNVSALADQMRGISARDVTFMTVPLATADYQTPTGELAVQWDAQAAGRLFQALANDQNLATPAPSRSPPARRRLVTSARRGAARGSGTAARLSGRIRPASGGRVGPAAGPRLRMPADSRCPRLPPPGPEPAGNKAHVGGATASAWLVAGRSYQPATTCCRVSRLLGHAGACATTLALWPICGNQSPGCRSASRRRGRRLPIHPAPPREASPGPGASAGRHRRPVPDGLPPEAPALVLAVAGHSGPPDVAAEITSIVRVDNPSLDVRMARDRDQPRRPGGPARGAGQRREHAPDGRPGRHRGAAARAALPGRDRRDPVRRHPEQRQRLHRRAVQREPDVRRSAAHPARRRAPRPRRPGPHVQHPHRGRRHHRGHRRRYPVRAAATPTSVLLAARLALPVFAAALDGSPSIGEAAAQLRHMGVGRIAIAPCIIGPEARPGELEAACASIGADSAAPLGAHDSVAKLMTLAYGQALAEMEAPGEGTELIPLPSCPASRCSEQNLGAPSRAQVARRPALLPGH